MAHPNYNAALTSISQTLRKDMTPEEKKLWYRFFKTRPETVYRQKFIGNYIVDFYIASQKIVIEIDGIQHTSQEHKQRDDERDSYLASLGITVLRYSNHSVNHDFAYVCEHILKHLQKDTFPSGDGGEDTEGIFYVDGG